MRCISLWQPWTSLIAVGAKTWETRNRPVSYRGELVDVCPEGVVFGGKFRSSPYDPLLQQLKAAGPGKFLKFTDLRCRPSVYARSKKLDIKVQFGEQGNTLWVTLAKADLEANGQVDPSPKLSNSDLVLQVLGTKPASSGEITTWLRSNGAPGIGITQVDGIISALMHAGKIRLSTPGTDSLERYELAAQKREAA